MIKQKKIIAYSCRVLLFFLFLSGLAPLTQLDVFRLGMLLTYPPRLLLLLLALLLLIYFLYQRAWVSSLFSLLTCLLLIYLLGWGGGEKPLPAQYYSLLTFNVHDSASAVPQLKALCDREKVDILVLQEVQPPYWEAFRKGLSDYRFFHGDRELKFSHSDWGPFSSLIAIRKTLIRGEPIVKTALTGYRTFGVEVNLAGQNVWLVNVHTTKAFWLHNNPIEFFTRSDYKSAWHAGEQRDLNQWLAAHKKQPVIVAGDFNAPLYSHNLRLEGLTNAHLWAGSGPHLTFPAVWPVWGLDHTFGNDGVKFYRYQQLDLGFSDHLAQLCHFSIMPVPTSVGVSH